MFKKKKKEPGLLQRLASGVVNAVKSAKENSAVTEELELAAAKKILSMAQERVASAAKALQTKRAKLANNS